MGFTAINVTAPTNNPSITSDDCNGKVSSRHARTVASEYLGRDKEEPLAEGLKPNGKGKKRTATINDVPHTKRCHRTANCKDGLANTKGTTRSPPDKPCDKVTPTWSKSNRDNTIPEESNVRQTSVGTREDEQVLISTLIPVSVYASATSMDALDTTSARTSCDSVKANAGHSFTVYRSSASSGLRSADVGIPKHCHITATDIVRYPLSNHAVQPDSNGKLDTVRHSTWNRSFEEDRDTVPTSHRTHTKEQRRAVSDEKTSTSKPIYDSFIQSPGATIEPGRSTRLQESTGSTTAKAAFEHNATTEKTPQRSAPTKDLEDETLFREFEDDDLVDVAKLVEDEIGRPATRSRSKNMREVEANEDYGGALFSHEERTLLATLKRPEHAPKPIVRKPFQSSVLDWSQLFGVSNSNALRTCFRVGEALNCGSEAVRSGTNIVLELYARVASSWREEKPGRKQHFVFRDLYHDKAPHLEGTFELWDQAALWDHDSKAFLGARSQGVMCRLIAKMRRDNQKWRLEVLSIWEATWEDIDYVAGIYAGAGEKDDDY